MDLNKTICVTKDTHLNSTFSIIKYLLPQVISSEILKTSCVYNAPLIEFVEGKLHG